MGSGIKRDSRGNHGRGRRGKGRAGGRGRESSGRCREGSTLTRGTLDVHVAEEAGIWTTRRINAGSLPWKGEDGNDCYLIYVTMEGREEPVKYFMEHGQF